MSQEYFFILYPEDSDAPDSEICHLLRADHNADSGEWRFPDGHVSCCGKRNALSGFNPESNDKLIADMNAIRIYLAKQQNAGIDFCAGCVATFYKED